MANGGGKEDIHLHHGGEPHPSKGLGRVKQGKNQPAEHR